MENIKVKEIAEMLTIKELLEKYPTGILSIVSDTFDLWKVITKYLPQIKEEILARDGKIVIRPDSGDPVDILCGKDISKIMLPSQFSIEERKGVVELLWDVFGGTVNEQGFKVLDPHIGVIYGDSITLDRCNEICERLAKKGFASTNVVFGIGSYTYQFNTRDTYGFAMKATYIEKEEIFYVSPESLEPGIRTVCQEIFKDPITDDGLKKSAKGLLKVIQGKDGLELVDQITWEQFNEEDNLLKIVYENGEFPNRITLTEIRNKLNEKV